MQNPPPRTEPLAPPADDPIALRILALSYFVQATGALSVVGNLQAITGEWQLSDAQAARLISVFGFTFAIAAPLGQVALGQWPRRRQVLMGLLVFSLASLGVAAADGYGGLLAGRFAMGLGAAFIGPVLGSLASGLVAPAQLGRAIATVLLGLSVAGLVGLPLAAWIAHAWGARTLFAAIGLAGLATALLTRWRVPGHVAGQRASLATLLRLLTGLRSFGAFLVVFLLAASVYTTLSFLSPILRDHFQAGPPQVSAALAVLGAAGVLGNLFVTRASQRASAERLLQAGMMLLALALAALWLAPPRPRPLPLDATLVVRAFATDILWPSQQRRVVELMPADRGLALALTASFVFGGIAFGSALGGWLYALRGLAGVLAGSLLLALSALTLALSQRSARRPEAAILPRG